MRFENHHAIVTGGASDIGLAVARQLHNEGARVTVWDVQRETLEALPDDIRARHIDVTDGAAIEAAMIEDMQEMGALDILVCGSGMVGPSASVINLEAEDWLAVMNRNLNATFWCNQAGARLMRPKGYGRIVNLAAIAGKEGHPNAAAYSASMAGVIGLTKSLGKELADTAITVNAVAPATVDGAQGGQLTPDFAAFMKSRIPMGRFGTPEEISAMICWLCSSEASFCTGAVFDQSGGRATY